MAGTTRHLHLDPLGGIAGDMFVAAMAHAFPAHGEAAARAAETVAGVPCRLTPHADGVLTGTRFIVDAPSDHHHAAWRDIRARIDAAPLPQAVRDHAIGIFTTLAEAEGRIHGVPPDRVSFHEVGAADSIADIVAAAWLVDAAGPASWSTAPLPMGAGRVRTEHGVLPVPAPATTLLLEGFALLDDGIAGERVTPTGAAILRHLGCTPRQGLAGRLTGSGHGFGTRRLPGISNVLRVLVFDTAPRAHRDLAVIGFEVDDQTPEDLAAGLERLRAIDGVHDVLQIPAYGKKGRVAAHLQLLVRPDALDAAVTACFRETTTIGLRVHRVQGHMLPRIGHSVTVDGAAVRVKQVERAGSRTGKAESDDLAHAPDQAARARLRHRAERLAEASEGEDTDG